MASSNDLIKYFTEEVVRYLDTPKQNRERKNKEPITYQWFGFIPLALKMNFHQVEIHFRIVLRLLIAGLRYMAIKVKNASSHKNK